MAFNWPVKPFEGVLGACALPATRAVNSKNSKMKSTGHCPANITRSLVLLSLLATASAFAQPAQPAQPTRAAGALRLPPALPALPGAQDAPRSVQPLARDSATVYRQALGDGRVLYTDTPVPGKKIEKVIEVDLRATQTWSSQPDLTPVAAQRPADAQAPSPAQPGIAADRPELAGRGLNAAQNRLAAAETQFASANAALQDIDAPLDGERSFNVNGTSRLNERYFARQTRQREAVRQSGLELDAALSQVRAAQGR